MNWDSPAEFFAMGGYALYVWGSFGVCALALVLEPFLLGRRRRGDPAQPAPQCAGRTDGQGVVMKNWKKRGAIVAGGLVARRHRRRAGAQCAQQQHRAVRHAQRSGRRQGAEGQAFRIGGMVKDGSVQARQPHRALRRHRHRQGNPRGLHRHPARPVQGGQRRGGAGQAGRRTASSPPPKCWPSTTRTTCRPQAQHAWTRRKQAQGTPSNHDPRTRAFRPHPGAVRGRRAGHAAAARRPPAAGANGSCWRGRPRRRMFLLVAASFAALDLELLRQRLLGRLRRRRTPTRCCRRSTGSPPSGAATKARCCCGC